MQARVETNTSSGFDLMPPTEIDEIIQNVRVIISTLKGTVPMDRGFGIDASVVDLPISAARAKITAQIAEAVSDAEPRAKVKRVEFTGDGANGKLNFSVIIEI